MCYASVYVLMCFRFFFLSLVFRLVLELFNMYLNITNLSNNQNLKTSGGKAKSGGKYDKYKHKNTPPPRPAPNTLAPQIFGTALDSLSQVRKEKFFIQTQNVWLVL